METARPARPADAAACTELLRQALADARMARGGPALAGESTPGDLLARWSGTTSAAALYVGEFDQAVVGLAAATAAVRPRSSTKSGRIECCYVETGGRGVGVGSALMAALVAWCAEQGCADIDALALPGDRHSKQRLEATGFTARLLVLNRRLS
jgi:GNAT superfamily N-acetyltransferase